MKFRLAVPWLLRQRGGRDWPSSQRAGLQYHAHPEKRRLGCNPGASRRAGRPGELHVAAAEPGLGTMPAEHDQHVLHKSVQFPLLQRNRVSLRSQDRPLRDDQYRQELSPSKYR